MTWRSGLAELKGTTVVVYLLSGQSIQGVLMKSYRDCIALHHPRHLDEQVDLEGSLRIPLDRVDYYQEL